jgi:hypothetical protein
MTPAKEMPNSIGDLTIYCGVRPGHGPVGEIVLPPTQPGVQVDTNLFPWSGFMRTQQLINVRSAREPKLKSKQK